MFEIFMLAHRRAQVSDFITGSTLAHLVTLLNGRKQSGLTSLFFNFRHFNLAILAQLIYSESVLRYNDFALCYRTRRVSEHKNRDKGISENIRTCP